MSALAERLGRLLAEEDAAIQKRQIRRFFPNATDEQINARAAFYRREQPPIPDAIAELMAREDDETIRRRYRESMEPALCELIEAMGWERPS